MLKKRTEESYATDMDVSSVQDWTLKPAGRQVSDRLFVDNTGGHRNSSLPAPLEIRG
jgi:hypothetical protein